MGQRSIEPERRERAILRLSRGGGDAVGHREFDLGSRCSSATASLPEAQRYRPRDELDYTDNARHAWVLLMWAFSSFLDIDSRGEQPARGPAACACLQVTRKYHSNQRPSCSKASRLRLIGTQEDARCRVCRICDTILFGQLADAASLKSLNKYGKTFLWLCAQLARFLNLPRREG